MSSRHTIVVAAAAPLALLLGACGSGSRSSAPPTSRPASSTSSPPSSAPASSTPAVAPTTGAGSPATSASPPTTAAGSASSDADHGVPLFQPSTVVSQAPGHTQLTTSADVATVTAYYDKALAQGGWVITSNAKTASSANFVVHKAGEGATIAVASAGPNGTSISVSSYPG